MDVTDRRERAGVEAAEWWVQLRSGDLSGPEREALVEWLRESPVHVAEMLRIARVHGLLGQFRQWSAIDTTGAADAMNVMPFSAAQVRTPPATARLTSRSRWLGALAAGLAGLVLAWFAFDLSGHTIETERGERREVSLADGSVLQVSPESRLRIDFDSIARRATLEHGAALFRVAKDPQRPFVVYVDDKVIRAIGTAFGVERREREMVVTVSDGHVEVTHRAATPTSRPVALKAGDQLTVPDISSGSPPRQAEVRSVDAALELAWAEGRLVFENETVADAIREFNRYNRVQLRVTDEVLARRPLSGVFDASDPESFIAFIESVERVRVIRESGRMSITLAPSADEPRGGSPDSANPASS